MITAVLDTNILVAGFVRRNPAAAPARLLDAWLAGAFTLVVSDYLLTEVADVLARPYFAQRLGATQVAAALATLRSLALVTPLTDVVTGIVADPKDDPILSTALSGKAQYLVSGDRALLQMETYQGVKILTARAFLDLLVSEHG